MTQLNLITGNIWVFAKDTTGELKKKPESIKADGDHLIGYIYVDHHAGISLKAHRLCKTGFFGRINVTGDIDKLNIAWTFRYSVFKNFEMRRMTNDEVHSFGLPTRPDYLEIYDDNEEYRQLRYLDLINPLRAPGFPDDIKFIMIGRAGREEIWGRLEKRLGKILYECELLNTPKQDFGVKAGDRVVVRIERISAGLIAQFISSKAALQQIVDNSPPYKWY